MFKTKIKALFRWSLKSSQPLRLVAAFCILTLGMCLPSHAEQPFDTNHAARLVWSTMVAIEQANSTGNYSVLRDASASSFQQSNNPAKLASLFQQLRDANVDLSSSLLLAPEYSIPPTIRNDGLLRMRGRFSLRPKAINFDLLFQLESGKWKIVGVAVIAGDPQKKP